MPETSTPAEAPARSRRNFFSFGFALLYLFVACIIALAVLPPLLNVNRFKRRIVTSISTSLGRPVHLDSVTLVLLPLPGFKLENFVVAEDPAFGSEPVIRANEVQATLRIPSLYSKKVEFSRISLKDPSINLVHAANGKWNVESILLKAAQISAAPTAQATAGPDPRFPYVEATDARVNIKSGLEKLPFSLTEADFALWLPEPSQWRVRIAGRPTRTDTSASDTGIVSLEGTLGRAERFDLIPIDLAAEWKNAPLGEASRVLTGNDAGVRGELRLSATLRGTVGTGILKSSIDLRGLRRADFVPDQPINLRADCQATAAETFHALQQIRCSWPPPGEPTLLALTGDLPNIHSPGSASFQLGAPGLPAATLLQWLRAASPRVSPEITATGTLTGSVSRTANDGQPGAPSMQSHRMGETYDSPVLSGHLALNSFTLSKGPLGNTPIVIGETNITSAPSAAGFVLAPTTLALGGREPATLEGHFDSLGYSLHLTGNVLPSRLLALGTAIPQFGDGLPALFLPPSAPQPPPSKELPIHVDLTSIRTWGGGQSWTRTAPAKPTHASTRKR
jgi:AsmA protein